MSNKSAGTAFEKEFAQLLSDHGFWVHRMQDNHNGQPFDIIAAQNGTAYGFDCKDCQRGVFDLCRIEENQILAMELWKQCGNGNIFLAVRMPASGIRMLAYDKAKEIIEKGAMSITEYALMKCTPCLKEWLGRINKV